MRGIEWMNPGDEIEPGKIRSEMASWTYKSNSKGHLRGSIRKTTGADPGGVSVERQHRKGGHHS